MSDLAKKLQTVEAPLDRVRRGPSNVCFPLYGTGDLEDWAEVERLRIGRTWKHVQKIVDEQAGVTEPIPNFKFKYHWRRICFCWPDELRL